MTKFNALLITLASALLSVGCYSGEGNIDEETATATFIDVKSEETAPVEPTKPVEVAKTYGFADTKVVCAKCDADLLAAKTRGVKATMESLIVNIGDTLPLTTPAVVHASDDDICSLSDFLAHMGGKFLSG